MKNKAAGKPIKTGVKKSTVTKSKAPVRGFRLKKILVPTDFSESSAKALDYAQAFAAQSQAEIILLHVVEPVSYPFYGQEITADFNTMQANLVTASHEHLARFSMEKAAHHGPMKLVVSEGGPTWEIIEIAKAEEVDLIILSTHGHSGIRHALLGSTAERVVRHAPCPVLTVRDEEHEFI